MEENINKAKNLSLYSFWRSSCSWRVRLVLHYKDIPFEYKPMHLIRQGNQELKDDFKKLNPMERIPVLLFEKNSQNNILVESTAICEFLEEEFPEKSLLPKDPVLRAKARAICSEIACGIQPFQNLTLLLSLEKQGVVKEDWAREYIIKGLIAVDKMVAEVRGKYCIGDEVTMADIFLVPQLYNARRYNADLTLFPNLIEIETNLGELNAFKNAHPDKQPDAGN
jgi:maleylacetoacetate isomerase